MLACACDARPDHDALAAWRAEAQDADARRSAEASGADGGAQWTLHIGGQVAAPLDLPLSEIQQSRDTIEITIPTMDVHDQRTFRGPRLAALIDRAQPKPEATSATFIATDGYFATIEFADLRAHPFILAFEQDGKPSLPSQGGPISVRFNPRALPDELVRRYQLADVFYVTQMVVGDEPLQLRIGKRTVDDAMLDALPEVSSTGTVMYRTGWESTSQTLWGVRLRDAARAAGVADPMPAMRIFAKGGHHDSKMPIPTFQAADLERCEPLLVRRFGQGRTRVPTRRGGPLLLSVKPACREALGRSAWLQFVEHVELP